VGRQENIIIGDGPLADLGNALRELRRRVGLTYRDMGAISNYSRAALNNAASGKRCPTWEVVQVFVTACGGEVDDRWNSLWEAAHASSPRRPRACKRREEGEEESETTPNPDKPPARITAGSNPWQDTAADFVYELNLLHKLAGSPNGATIYQAWRERTSFKPRASERKDLPKSTLRDALKLGRRTLPKLEVVQMIVHACGADVWEWTESWKRIATLEFEARNPRPGTCIVAVPNHEADQSGTFCEAIETY
jgi:transcriptional regulator with XRE-family HTH domain